ncbi:unnamed protein product [Staurois parvus]|uniref:Uncharacterized protein n=1 Tax=Staurois parvus TaxID=386267 RepID=A0ABN9E3T4_9NEOB|nr:unnamed protein product [Staurois parvus]
MNTMKYTVKSIQYMEDVYLPKDLYLNPVLRFMSRGGLTIWKLGHCPRARRQ